jgi:membrane-associated protease RseP (regulator of RpoE activity)
MIALLLTVAAALAVFYFIVFQLDVPGAWKFAMVFAEMIAVNQLLIKRYNLSSELGLVLLKSKKGIELIDSLARNAPVFNFLADAGSAISYGALSFVLMRRNVSLKSAAVGFAALAVLSVLVAPVALSFLLLAVKGAAGGGSSTTLTESQDIGFAVVSLVLLVGGLFLFILFGIVFYGITVFKALVTSLFFGSDAIANTSAGGTLLLPGVNLPFFEGILALAIVMVLHEGAHAVLARIAKVPIVSSGIVLFGIIPVGAFVEPDEKKLESAEAHLQTRVLVAGPSSNLLASIIFFSLFMAFFFATPAYREEGLLVRSGMEPGTVIYQIDGQFPDLYNFTPFELPKDSEVTLETNRGPVVRQTNDEGKLGITFNIVTRDSIFSVYSNPAMEFAYTLLGLCVALNFVVGAVNILPIPLFDGYRIVDANIKNKLIVKAISYTALFFFILNFLPLLFH